MECFTDLVEFFGVEIFLQLRRHSPDLRTEPNTFGESERTENAKRKTPQASELNKPAPRQERVRKRHQGILSNEAGLDSWGREIRLGDDI